MRPRKENHRISTNPSELLNNIKYLKDKKSENPNPTTTATSSSLKKTHSNLKKQTLDTQDTNPQGNYHHLYIPESLKKHHIGSANINNYFELKSFTQRSPAKKGGGFLQGNSFPQNTNNQQNNEQARSTDLLVKRRENNASAMNRNQAKSSEKDSFKQIYGRTLRFKTTVGDAIATSRPKKESVIKNNTAQSGFQPAAQGSERHKTIFDILTPLSPRKSLKKTVQEVRDKFIKLDSVMEGTSSTISELVDRFRQLFQGLIQTVLRETAEKLSIQQNIVEEVYDRMSQIKSELIAGEQDIERLKLEVETWRKKAQRESKINEKYREEIETRMKREKENNQLLYHLRIKGVDVDLVYYSMKRNMGHLYGRESKDEELAQSEQQSQGQFCEDENEYGGGYNGDSRVVENQSLDMSNITI